MGIIIICEGFRVRHLCYPDRSVPPVLAVDRQSGLVLATAPSSPPLEGVVEVVGEIVKQIHAFSLATDLGLALRTSIIDPSMKAHLLEAVGKLGRYYFSTSELVCAAKHRACRLFESIKVTPFHIPMPTSISKSR